ncbi:MAG TPA: tetratricopeptide repeat protein [Ktedonobacterales bacterium]|jgi:tetratricopeptide (TPR) repeat protein
MMDIDGPLAGVVGGLLGLVIVAYIVRRNDEKNIAGERNPWPSFRLRGAANAARRSRRAARVPPWAQELQQISWEDHVDSLWPEAVALERTWWRGPAAADRREAERGYYEALNLIFTAEGDPTRFGPALDQLRALPLDLAFSGVARVILTPPSVRGVACSPEGVQLALTYTLRAVQANPLSADAWVMRLWVAVAASTRSYHVIAEHVLSQAQALAPSHPYLPEAEALYLQRHGRPRECEAALRRMIQLAPTDVVKSAGYDRLALFYADHGRLNEALELYQNVLREFPAGSAWLWRYYALILMRAKRYHEALDSSDRALAYFEFGSACAVNNDARRRLVLQRHLFADCLPRALKQSGADGLAHEHRSVGTNPDFIGRALLSVAEVLGMR